MLYTAKELNKSREFLKEIYEADTMLRLATKDKTIQGYMKYHKILLNYTILYENEIFRKEISKEYEEITKALLSC